jgi:hypothetical protein
MSGLDTLSEEARKFLKDAYSLNLRFNAIIEKGDTIRLCMSFWKLDEILEGDEIKEDWDVENGDYPFYGDWHDIFCIRLTESTEMVVALNDNREVQATWKSIQEFYGSLKRIDVDSTEKNSDGILESDSWLNF